jgi:hypothetical protein
MVNATFSIALIDVAHLLRNDDNECSELPALLLTVLHAFYYVSNLFNMRRDWRHRVVHQKGEAFVS